MSDKNTASIHSLIKFALPLGASLVAGTPQTEVTWSVTVRAQPPAFPEIYGGELALVSMQILHSFDSRITLASVMKSLSNVGVVALAVSGEILQTDIAYADELNVALISLAPDTSLASAERAVNKLILSQSTQITERALEIQRQLARLVTENRDLNSLLQVIARAVAKPIVVHDDAGVVMAQVSPNVGRRTLSGRSLIQSLPYGEFQKWLHEEAGLASNGIMQSPIGYTAFLKVEKRVAGYFSLVDRTGELDEFDRLVLTYGADVCAIELAKNRAIASAVEQARGDWIQMWLSGTPTDDDLLTTRAQQAGFTPEIPYLVAVFRAMTDQGQSLPLESLLSLVRDDMARRQIQGAVGQYVDVIVVLLPIPDITTLPRVRATIEELRQQLATRTPTGLVASGLSRPATGLYALRESYREAKDAVSIAYELGDSESTTYYGDLKLYQFLLGLKESNFSLLRRFFDETLEPLVEHDGRKQSDLIRTLNGFFDANGNLAKAAQDLDVHRNTLVYRLERIVELTDLDLDDADNRLILHLALKIQRVLATMPVQ